MIVPGQACTASSSAGFSLLEMIGVMAVMAILAGALAPSVFQMMEAGYETAEADTMQALGAAYQGYVVRSKSIPAAADWVDDIADYAGYVPLKVAQNEKGFARRIYFDPTFFTSSPQAFSGYVQDTGLSARPYSPRIMLVSSLDQAISASLNTQARFDAVWAQSTGALITESKSTLIERINLTPDFVRVVLSNSAASQVGYSLEGGTEAAVAAASGGSDGQRTVYLISDTLLQLRGDPYPGAPVLRQQLVSREGSYRYAENSGVWSWYE